MHWFIDPPTPFAPMKELLEFQRQLATTYPQDDPQVMDEMRSIAEAIAFRKTLPE